MKTRTFVIILILVLAVLLISSCATTPETKEEIETIFLVDPFCSILIGSFLPLLFYPGPSHIEVVHKHSLLSLHLKWQTHYNLSQELVQEGQLLLNKTLSFLVCNSIFSGRAASNPLFWILSIVFHFHIPEKILLQTRNERVLFNKSCPSCTSS